MLTSIPHVFIVLVMEHLKRAIEHVGSQAELARRVNVVQQVVSNWLRRGNVPADYCPSIERATGGTVRCEDLRPDVDWAYLRATDCAVKVSASATATETHQEAA